MKKKIIKMAAMAILTCVALAGCGKKASESSASKEMSRKSGSNMNAAASMKENEKEASDKKLSVVCTIFPEYDWVKEVVGDKKDNYDITYLLENGVDLHSYQPTAEDMAKISSCDLFVYVGGESDGWVEKAVKDASNPNMQVINLMETLGSNVKEEEVVEGMQGHDHEHEHEEDADHDHKHEHEEDEDHDHKHEHEEDTDHDHKHEHEEDADHDHDHEHEHEEDEHHHHHEGEETEYDEHVWLSLKNVPVLVNEIAAKLQIIDPENKDVYTANSAAYIQKITELDAKYVEVVKNSSKKTILFGDRFPFRYLADDYGLKYYAAFVGCSAETEASFETVAFLAGKTDELGLSRVCTIENSDGKIADTVIQNTKNKDQKIAVLNSMQSVTANDIESGVTYLSIMEENLKVLEEVLK